MFIKKPRLLVQIMIVVIIIATLSACTSKTTPTPLTPVTVQLSWVHHPEFAGFYAANQNGYFADEGLLVTFLPGGPGVDKLSVILDGKAQFGIAGPDELILARSEGKPVKAIATSYRRSPIVFLSLADKGITSPQDFLGKQIRTTANAVVTLQAMLSKVGVSPDQVTMVADLPSDLTVFASGDVPVWSAYINGFVVSLEQEGYQINIIYPDNYGVHFYADTIYTTDDLITTNPDLIVRFLRASLKGWTYAVENPADIPAMLLKYDPETDTEIALEQLIASLPLII